MEVFVKSIYKLRESSGFQKYVNNFSKCEVATEVKMQFFLFEIVSND